MAVATHSSAGEEGPKRAGERNYSVRRGRGGGGWLCCESRRMDFNFIPPLDVPNGLGAFETCQTGATDVLSVLSTFFFFFFPASHLMSAGIE